MKTSEILQSKKEELINSTLELMPIALSGDLANRTFYFEINNDGYLIVDYLYYAGQQQLTDNCFYTIKDIETPCPEDYGYSDISGMNFEECGYAEQIENAIDDKIALIENQD